MRTSSPLHSSGLRKGRSRVRIWSVGVLVMLLLVLLYGVLPAPFSFVTAPLLRAKTWMQTTQDPLTSFFRTHTALSREITALREALRANEYDRARLAALEAERAQWEGVPADRIWANVVMRPGETPYDTILLGSGSSEGIKEGAIVYAGQTAIGIVVRAYPKSAFVALFSMPGEQSPVYIFGANVYARATGEGGGVIKISVPQGIVLKVGDAVVVPLSDTALYGTIDYIEANPSDPDQYAYVTQRTALSSLYSVFVDREPLAPLSREDIDAIVHSLRESTSTPEMVLETLPLATTTAEMAE